MSNLAYKNLKNKLKNMYQNNFAIEIGIYDNNNNLTKEKIVPLGNYIYDPLPYKNEKKITAVLCSRGKY